MTNFHSISGIPVAALAIHVLCWTVYAQDNRANGGDASQAASPQEPGKDTFQKQIQPLLTTYCVGCHNADEMTSGIRVDHLNGAIEDDQLFLLKDILKQVSGGFMPPEDEPQPTDQQRRNLVEWIRQGMAAARQRTAQKNGSLRRLTVSQYRNTLRDLLGIEDQLTDVLPPDAVSKDGFVNNQETMLLAPLLVEAYFDIAQKALDRCIVDATAKPMIQKFRMELGASINAEPFPDKLVLGASSLLLPNQDFVVTQLPPTKPFEFDPLQMRTKYEFIEGYQGNDTVRGWRKFDSIYHAVFACMRGTEGYPKGNAWETVPEGLLLRPAIPSEEIFGRSSTYGSMSNFKISLRELPDQGNFRVTVRAAKYEDGLLLDPGTEPQVEPTEGAVTVTNPMEPQTVNIEQTGAYQVDVYLDLTPDSIPPPDASKLRDGLIGAWSLDGDARSPWGEKELVGELAGDAKFVDSPFGQAIALDGNTGAAVIPYDDAMNVADGPFTVAAWIRPRELRQAGIVCLGGYGFTHGWLFDMSGDNGVLRIETANADGQHNGTAQSRTGVLRAGRWQHVAVVVRRGGHQTRLYVNGYEVGVGTVNAADLDNPSVALHIGRIQNSKLFAGEIDEVRIYRRALDVAELAALVEPGKQFADAPPTEGLETLTLTLTLGDRHFSRIRSQPAFLAVRLPAGPLSVATPYGGNSALERIVFTPLKETHPVAQQLKRFEKRSPRVGVHVGLRRDCGSTLTQVGSAQTVSSVKLQKFVFEGAINNYPSPDVEKNNVNYLAGVREIGVRSEYTDGRDMPRLLIRSIDFEGPFYETWPPAPHRNIFIDSDHQDDPPAYARDVIRSFASRAFRRPVTGQEEASLIAVWERSFAENNDFQESIQDALLVILTSPQFLFLIESSESPEPEKLDSHELASKLSYFLWNTAPDRQLRELAAADNLHESLDAEIERMVRDPRFRQFAHEFASQWLNLDKFDVVEVDYERYPKLTRDVKTELRKEPVRFLQYLIQQNLPLRNLIQSDFIMANEVVAGYYNLADRTEKGFEFVAIRHESENLGGVLAQAGILAGLSDGRESNPVKRGAWLARKIIAEPPDDPPPNVPNLEEDTAHLSLRERLELHRDQPGCAKCHDGIDPWGLPFEQFDAGGLFKNEAGVDASSTLPDETEVANVNELKTYLSSDRLDQVAFSFLKHLSTYAIGRSLSFHELEFLKEKGVELRSRDYRMQDMVRFVVKSDMFLDK